MANGIQIDLEGVQSTINRLRNVSSDVAKEVDNEIAAGVRLMEKAAKQLAPVNYGVLRNSISVKPVQFLTWELVAQNEYAAYMEFGTKNKVQVPSELKDYAAKFKGKGKGGGDLWPIIKKWCQRKKIDKALWFFIYMEIVKNGIKPHPFFFPAYFQYRKEIIKNVTKVINEKR